MGLLSPQPVLNSGLTGTEPVLSSGLTVIASLFIPMGLPVSSYQWVYCYPSQFFSAVLLSLQRNLPGRLTVIPPSSAQRVCRHPHTALPSMLRSPLSRFFTVGLLSAYTVLPSWIIVITHSSFQRIYCHNTQFFPMGLLSQQFFHVGLQLQHTVLSSGFTVSPHSSSQWVCSHNTLFSPPSSLWVNCHPYPHFRTVKLSAHSLSQQNAVASHHC